MKYLLLLCMLCGCGISKSMDNISGNMDGLNNKIGSMVTDIGGMSKSLSATKDALHSQSLMLALNEILKPENTKYITLSSVNTIPMGAAAQAFANIATADELAGLAFLWISEINLSQVDGVDKKTKDSIDLGKYIKLNALQMISGLIPEKTMIELYKTQITNGGIYESDTYGIISLRYGFIKDFMVEQYLATPMTNQVQYKTVLDYLDQLNNILKLPFKGNAILKIYGMYDTKKIGLNSTIKIEDTNLCKYYQSLQYKYTKEFNVKKYNSLTNIENDIKMKLGECK